jgi:murein L,D-transpeptidase YafK
MAVNFFRVAFASVAALLVAGCQQEGSRYPARAYAPIPGDTLSLMASKGANRNSPVLLRAYKKESEIEMWKQNAEGRYVHVKTYPVCRWSGQLGPKKREGDRQVPEGFYTVTPAQMNPNSAYWLAFNVGYPNPMEKAMGRNGGDIMVHGTCSSRGCFAMTNEQIEEIYAVMRESFNGGQKGVQFQSYPFRMTAENLARFRHDPNMPFWKNLKEGNDHFEVTQREPQVAYCGGRYVYNSTLETKRLDPVGACPTLRMDDTLSTAVAAKQRQDAEKVAELVHKGTTAVRVQYADGSQHMSFRSSRFAASGADERFATASLTAGRLASLGEISRPDAVDAIEEYAVDASGQRTNARTIVTRNEPASSATASTPQTSTVARSQPSAPAATAALPGLTPAVPAVASVPVAAPQPGLFGTFFAGAEPAAAPGATVATSAPTQPPLMKRLFGVGSDPEPAVVVPVEAAQPVPSKVPLPPRRQAQVPQRTPASPGVPVLAAPRQAALAPQVLAGAQPIVGMGLSQP